MASICLLSNTYSLEILNFDLGADVYQALNYEKRHPYTLDKWMNSEERNSVY